MVCERLVKQRLQRCLDKINPLAQSMSRAGF